MIVFNYVLAKAGGPRAAAMAMRTPLVDFTIVRRPEDGLSGTRINKNSASRIGYKWMTITLEGTTH
jgi:hypothetical protein